jgi:uncharacterized protein YggE
MNPSKLSPSLLVLGLLLVLAPHYSHAAGTDDTGITVTGTGEVKAKPTSLEIDLQASGNAELTSDALVKYRDALTRVKSAFDELKLKGLSVEQRALSIQNNGAAANNPNMVGLMVDGGAQPAAKAQIDINRSLRLKVAGLEDMDEEQLTELVGKLLDTAKDAGANVVPGGDGSASMIARMYGQQVSSSVVTYVVDDAEEHRKKAYGLAYEKARANATRLADLAGVKLGRVVSVEESPSAGGSTSMQARMMAAVYGMEGLGDSSDQRVTSDKFDEIPINITLRVRFAIEERKTGK